MFDEISMNLMRHIRDTEIQAAHAEGRERPVAPGEALVDRMVEEFERPDALPGRASTTTRTTAASTCGRG